jgi:hypothetical protein
MNWVAGTVPCAFGEHGEVPASWQPASGSGKTLPKAWYCASLVATGDATAAGQKLRMTAVTAAAMTRICVDPPQDETKDVQSIPEKAIHNPLTSRDPSS